MTRAGARSLALLAQAQIHLFLSIVLESASAEATGECKEGSKPARAQLTESFFESSLGLHLAGRPAGAPAVTAYGPGSGLKFFQTLDATTSAISMLTPPSRLPTPNRRGGSSGPGPTGTLAAAPRRPPGPACTERRAGYARPAPVRRRCPDSSPGPAWIGPARCTSSSTPGGGPRLLPPDTAARMKGVRVGARARVFQSRPVRAGVGAHACVCVGVGACVCVCVIVSVRACA